MRHSASKSSRGEVENPSEVMQEALMSSVKPQKDRQRFAGCVQEVKSSFQELQRFGVTNEEGVVPSMAIEIVRSALSDVRFIS